MDDEGSAHSQDSTEKAGLEHHIVAGRSLPGSRARRCGGAGGRPVVASERERSEIDLMRELDEALERGGPRLEGCRPGIYVRDAFQTACSAPAAVSPVFLTSQERCEACPSFSRKPFAAPSASQDLRRAP
jgi:hypothetical protein